MQLLHLLVILIISYVSAGPNDRYLVSPNPEKCKTRFKEFQYEGRNYFYSGHDKELKDQKTDWLDSRNTCRERCMETISLETQAEFDFIKKYIEDNNIKFIWTSGRLCDFAGCEGRWDLLPKIIKGWLWSANQNQIDDTDKIPKGWDYTPWSRNGTLKRRQPDNAEFYINQATESCLGVLNNQYNDSITWHDIACYHRTGFICEDSAELLSEAQEIKSHSENREEIIEIAPQKTITEPRPTTTSAPRSTGVPTSAKITSERRTTPVTTTVRSTTERKTSIIVEKKETEEQTTTIKTPKRPSFGGRRTSTPVTEEAPTTEEIPQTPRKLILDTEENLKKSQVEIPVVVAKLEDEPEIFVKAADEPVVIVKIEEEIKVTPIIEEITTVETITTEEPKVSLKKIFTKRKKIFGKLKPQSIASTEELDSFSPAPEQISPVSEVKTNFRKIKPRPIAATEEPETLSKAPEQITPVSEVKTNFRKIKPRPIAVTEEPETLSTATEQISPVSEVKKNFRKIKPRPITSTEQPDIILSTTEQLPSVPIVRKSFRKLVTRTTTTTEPETIRSSENLSEPSRPKKILGKLKFRASTTEEPETTSSTTEQIQEETSVISTEASISKASDDLIELQKLDEPVIIETTTTTTEEPEPEERRAIPIKRKQVKLYRKAYKTTTEANDGPSQSIEINDETTKSSPIPIRRKVLKQKFRARLNQS